MFPWTKPCSRPEGERCDCCWTFGDFALTTDDEAVLQRRLSMCVILAVRVVVPSLKILYHDSGTSILLLLWNLLAGLGDLCWSGLMLTTIERSHGRRTSFKITMNRTRFGVALYICAIYHVSWMVFCLMDWHLVVDTLGLLLIIVLNIIARQPREDVEVKS